MQFVTDLFVSAQGWLFDSLVQPVLFALGLGGFVEMGFEGIEFVRLQTPVAEPVELHLLWMRQSRNPALRRVLELLDRSSRAF